MIISALLHYTLKFAPWSMVNKLTMATDSLEFSPWSMYKMDIFDQIFCSGFSLTNLTRFRFLPWSWSKFLPYDYGFY